MGGCSITNAAGNQTRVKRTIIIVTFLGAAMCVARADVTNEVARSVHAQLQCADCHAGKLEDKRAIAGMCASCHGDVRKMNPYGLPTDQLDRYKTSKHGEQLFEHNDQKVAGCTDCHGAHDILKVHAPDARTFPANIPATCGRCHSDEKLMSQYKLPANVVEEYKTSYHAHMLFDKGDASAPTCVTCHGNHGATPPGTAEVGQVCGKCHGRQRELFEKSPHADAAKAGVFNECISCHGNHAIQKASVELFATSCVQCHANDPKQLVVRDTMANMIRRAKDDYERADATVHDATVRGLATEDEQLLLQEAKTQITQMEALQHTLSYEQLKPVNDRADELVKLITADIAHLERVELWKRKALWPIWAFLAFMAVVFWAKRRQLE
jgi:cytochrome c553